MTKLSPMLLNSQRKHCRPIEWYTLFWQWGIWFLGICHHGFPGGSEVKASAWNVGYPCSIPELGRSPGKGNGNPLQYTCLENPMEGGAWSQRVGHDWVTSLSLHSLPLCFLAYHTKKHESGPIHNLVQTRFSSCFKSSSLYIRQKVCAQSAVIYIVVNVPLTNFMYLSAK